MEAGDCGRLTLIGTVHRDPAGGERLLPLLRQLQPRQITLEMSEAALAYRLGDARRLLLRLERILDRLCAELGCDRQDLDTHGAVADIRTLLALPFEYQAAHAFAAESGASLHLIDLSEISARKLRKVESDLITERNLRILVKLPPRTERSPEEGYITARAMVELDPGEAVRQAFLERRRGEEGIGPRDSWMAQTIRKRLTDHPDCPLVHVGGWVHLVEDARGETLFSRLGDLKPKRVLLG